MIDPHPRARHQEVIASAKVYPDTPAPELCWSKQGRFKVRTMSERVNGRLKVEFGASQIRVRGAAKVMAHLMFGALVLTVDQWLRMASPLAG